jgi:AraC-like DNA-binding protein
MVHSNRGRAEDIPSFVVKFARAGTIVYAPGGCFGPRMQQDLQLVLLHTGSMRVQIDDKLLQMPTGHVVLLKPGHMENFIFAEEQETWHRWIAISTELLSDEALYFFEHIALYIPLSDRMNRITELMLLFQNAILDCEVALNELARAALALYVSEASQFISDERVHPAILTVKEHIHQFYDQELNLSILAARANTTKEHLIRLFQKTLGITPTQYLWTFRVNQGLDLLRSTGLTIGEIAERVGFKTSYHFARVIKKQTGKTASDIRKESWQGI